MQIHLKATYGDITDEQIDQMYSFSLNGSVTRNSTDAWFELGVDYGTLETFATTNGFLIL